MFNQKQLPSNVTIEKENGNFNVSQVAHVFQSSQHDRNKTNLTNNNLGSSFQQWLNKPVIHKARCEHIERGARRRADRICSHVTWGFQGLLWCGGSCLHCESVSTHDVDTFWFLQKSHNISSGSLFSDGVAPHQQQSKGAWLREGSVYSKRTCPCWLICFYCLCLCFKMDWA